MTDHLNWLELADQAQVDPLELKKRLDLVAVCEELGILLEEGQDGKWSGLCPFHDDHRPSFDVYETDEGFQRCGCWACDFGPSNDVYDLLKELRGYGFGQALGEAQRLAVTTRASETRERRGLARPDVDLSNLVDAAHANALADAAPIRSLLADRSIRVPADWVTAEFGLGVTPDGGAVVIPHRGADGRVTGAKTRRPTFTDERPWCPVAVGGSKLSQLYGLWRDQGRLNVVIVEGESDTWALAWLLRGRDDVEVFGLPSGAAARPRREWLEHLAERNVTLMFDADAGGRTALANWVAGLSVCRIAQLSEGMDVTSESPERVLQALASAVPYGTAPAAGLVEAAYGGHLVKAGDQDQTMVSDFLPELVETVELPSGDGRVFRLLVKGEVVDLPTWEFATDRSFRKWANRHGLTWQGGSRETQELHRMLLNQGVFRPRLRGQSTAGWTPDQTSFVLPEPIGTLGSKAYTYVTPETVRNLHELVYLQHGPWDPQIPTTLASLHRPDVMTPILGWVAASFLRPMVQAFPFLGVVGVAGAGKSTLLREVLRTFGLAINLTLTSTTPMSLTGFAASTNALPVWVDEYRAGAREGTRAVFEQVLRDAWESQASYKGGFGDQKQEVHALSATAPLVVTGEDAFSETSHLERSVMVSLPREGRNVGALSRLYGLERQGFGRVYLEWLMAAVAEDTLPETPRIHDRPAHARAVAAWGYDVFSTFARDVCGAELVPFDAAKIELAHDTSRARPAVVELIYACEGRWNNGSFVARKDGEDMLVRPYDMVHVAKMLSIPIPGGARALRNELSELFECREERDGEGTHVRVIGFNR